MPLSEFQTTTIHEVNNNSLQDAPQMIDPEDVDYNQSCPKCVHVVDLNEALIEENERLRDHMESMIVLVQKFEADKA